MQVNIKQYEAWCLEYAKRFNNKGTWEMYCLAKDAWLDGYKKGREATVEKFVISQEEALGLSFQEAIAYIKRELYSAGGERINIEIASNQIGQKE